jgi:hypothetical protein
LTTLPKTLPRPIGTTTVVKIIEFSRDSRLTRS